MERVIQIIKDIIVKEGGGKYTDHPKDSGGPTRWGITEATARAFGYAGDMRRLPKETAVEIYLNRYWINPGFDRVDEIHPALAEQLLNFGVLAGPNTSALMLQRVLNVLNRNERDYPDIVVDGRIGPITLHALRAFLDKRGSIGATVLNGMVTALQSVYLIEIAERRPKDEEWQYGWQLNRAIGAIL